MALETATYIDGLVATNPAASDAISTADDHLRLIKSTIKATFPNISGAVTKTQAELNVPTAPLDSPALTGTPTAPTAAPGTNTTQLATTAFVQAARTAVLEAVYPIGSIYTNATNSTNPGTLLGFGTWAAFGAGRVPVGVDASDPLFDTAEETGGSKDATLVSHTHTFSGTTSNRSLTGNFKVGGPNQAPDGTIFTAGGDLGPRPGLDFASGSQHQINFNASHDHTFSGTTASSGSSGTNANLQPYITVYMWKRTA
jgi:hypothetical protein